MRRLTSEERETLQTHNTLAPRWDSFNPKRMKDENFTDFFSRIPRGGLLLDSGCATGSRDAELVNREGFRYMGIDLSESMITIGHHTLRELPNAKAVFACMDAHALAFRSGTFNAFPAINLFQHIHREDTWKVLGEHRRVLKPNGVGLVSLALGEGSEMHRSPSTGERTLVVRWQPEKFEEAIRWAGLKTLRFRRYNNLLMYTVGK